MKKYRYKFSIYTPVYNTGRTIERVYNSLKVQTIKDFEWIIINDGSTDNSAKVIQDLIKNCNWPVNFINFKKNVGFNRSLNFAVKQAKGEFFLIAHSDDAFVPNTLEIFLKNWESLSLSLQTKLHGVKCNCLDQFGNKIGDPFPEDYLISDVFELQFKYKIKGEKWGTIKTDILKEFPFPEEYSFTPENLIWNRIYYKYPALHINEYLRIYYVNESATSLSNKVNESTKYSNVKRMVLLEFINLYFDKVIKYPVSLIKIYISFWRYSFEINKPFMKSLSDINGLFKKLIALLFFPIGALKARK